MWLSLAAIKELHSILHKFYIQLQYYYIIHGLKHANQGWWSYLVVRSKLCSVVLLQLSLQKKKKKTSLQSTTTKTRIAGGSVTMHSIIEYLVDSC